MSKEEEIIDELAIFDDGTHIGQTPRDQTRMIIAETLLRIPKTARKKVMEEATIIIVGEAYGTVYLMIPSELKSEDQLIKGSNGLVHVKIEVEIILLNFGLMERNKLNEEGKGINVAHEIAHFILGHHRLPGRALEREKEADDLIVEWGFKRAYQSYEQFAHS